MSKAKLEAELGTALIESIDQSADGTGRPVLDPQEAARRRAQVAEITGQTEPGLPVTKVFEAVLLLLAYLVAFFTVIAVPQPIFTVKPGTTTFNLSMFDSVKALGCSAFDFYSRAAGTFGIIAELMSIGTIVLMTKQMSNTPLVNYGLLHRAIVPFWLLIQNICMMVCWGIVAHMRHAKLCGNGSNKSIDAYGAAFGLMLFSWLLESMLLTGVLVRHVVWGKHRYSVFANMGVGKAVFTTSTSFGDKEEVAKKPPKGWEKYVENMTLYGQIGIILLVIVALPQEAFSSGGNHLTLFGINQCSGDESRGRAAGAFGYFTIFFGVVGASLLYTEFRSGRCLGHNLLILAVFALQSLSNMISWAIVAAVYHHTDCGSSQKNLADTDGASYGAAFVALIVAWMFHFLVIAAYVMRKFGGGKRPISELPPEDLLDDFDPATMALAAAAMGKEAPSAADIKATEKALAESIMHEAADVTHPSSTTAKSGAAPPAVETPAPAPNYTPVQLDESA